MVVMTMVVVVMMMFVVMIVNTDIFVVRTDGSRLTQLTFNPSSDMCPVWAKDGRSIYFLSTRANRESKYNIWRMNFNIE
jgi:Tol biopolymer transport system component